MLAMLTGPQLERLRVPGRRAHEVRRACARGAPRTAHGDEARQPRRVLHHPGWTGAVPRRPRSRPGRGDPRHLREGARVSRRHRALHDRPAAWSRHRGRRTTLRGRHRRAVGDRDGGPADRPPARGASSHRRARSCTRHPRPARRSWCRCERTATSHRVATPRERRAPRSCSPTRSRGSHPVSSSRSTTAPPWSAARSRPERSPGSHARAGRRRSAACASSSRGRTGANSARGVVTRRAPRRFDSTRAIGIAVVRLDRHRREHRAESEIDGLRLRWRFTWCDLEQLRCLRG